MSDEQERAHSILAVYFACLRLSSNMNETRVIVSAIPIRYFSAGTQEPARAPSGDVLTEPEAAEYLRMTERMLADRRRARKIAYMKDGHAISYSLADLIEYRERMQCDAN